MHLKATITSVEKCFSITYYSDLNAIQDVLGRDLIIASLWKCNIIRMMSTLCSDNAISRSSRAINISVHNSFRRSLSRLWYYIKTNRIWHPIMPFNNLISSSLRGRTPPTISWSHRTTDDGARGENKLNLTEVGI